MGHDDDKYDDVDDETGERGRRGAPHPWLGFAKRPSHPPPRFTFPPQEVLMRSRLDLDWSGGGGDETVWASQDDGGGVEADVRVKACGVGLAGRPPFYARGRHRPS